MHNIGARDEFSVIAQSITSGGGDLDITKITLWVCGVLVLLVALFSVWRIFKNYANSGKDGKVVSPEERAKETASIIIDGGITAGAIVVAGTVIGVIATMIQNAVT